MSRALVLGIFFIAAAPLGACSFLVPFADYDRETAVTDAGDAGDGATCSADLRSDPMNCGACGHDCRGSSCLEGLCDSQMILPAGRTVAKMTIDDEFIYVAYPETGELFHFAKGAELTGNERFATGLTGVVQMFQSGNDIFWLHPASKAGAKLEIGRTSKTGGTAPERVALAVEHSLTTADATSLYYVDELGNLFAIDRALAGPPRAVATGIFTAFADGDSLYATAYPSGTSVDGNTDRIVRMDKNGKNVLALATGQPAPTTVATDEAFVYWSNTGMNSALVRLSKSPAADAAPQQLYAAAQNIYLAKVLGDFLYFVTVAEQTAKGESRARVWRLPKSGGAPLALTREISYTAFTVDTTYLYWASGGAIYRAAN